MTTTTVERASKLTDIEGAASYLLVSTSTIRRMIANDELPHVRIGRRVLLRIEDLDTAIEAGRSRDAS